MLSECETSTYEGVDSDDLFVWYSYYLISRTPTRPRMFRGCHGRAFITSEK
jgi:hypothetical protein